LPPQLESADQKLAGQQAIDENAVPVPNFMATICKALGLDPTKQNMSNVGRPIRLADAGSKPIKEVLA
jgi:hydrogenase maturation factor